MPNFHYIARDAHGAEVRGRLEAASRKQALAQLRARQLTPSRLDEGAGAPAESGAPGVFGSDAKRFRREHALPFLRALMGLVNSGVQTADGVKLLSRRLSDPALRGLAGALWEQLSQGRSLSQAMLAQGAVFDDSTVHLIEAGEATGRLGGVLERLVADMEERAEIRSRLIGAMAYPAMIVLMAVVVLLIVLFFVMPRIEMLLSSLHGQLPLSTRLLMGLANFTLHYGWFFALVGVTAASIFWTWRRKPEGRLATDRWLLKVTGVGSFLVANDALRLTQTLGLLLENGISTLPALAMTERTIQNRVFRAAFADARAKIAEGAAISAALAGTGFLPALSIDVLAVGETTGNIVPSLKDVARDFRKQIGKAVGVFIGVISYGALLVAAAFVGLLAFGIISAVFQISSSLKAG